MALCNSRQMQEFNGSAVKVPGYVYFDNSFGIKKRAIQYAHQIGGVRLGVHW